MILINNHRYILRACIQCDVEFLADAQEVQRQRGNFCSRKCRVAAGAYTKIHHGDAIGGSVSAEYRAWRGVKTRCLNAADHSYPYYGGRGITICDAWRDSFEAFLVDVGRRPSPAHSLDRLNVDGNYEPGNVRWATRVEQQQNKRNNRLITLDGVTRCAVEWAAHVGISQSALMSRLARGWSIEKALTEPREAQKFLTLNGVTMRQYEWAAATGISQQEIYGRLRRGWSVERALTTMPSPRLMA